jgi:hypothetical protein
MRWKPRTPTYQLVVVAKSGSTKDDSAPSPCARSWLPLREHASQRRPVDQPHQSLGGDMSAPPPLAVVIAAGVVFVVRSVTSRRQAHIRRRIASYRAEREQQR